MNNVIYEWLQNPKNVGQMRDADGTGKIKGAVCKSFSKLFVKVENNVIVETKFQTYGGVLSIVACSVVSELIKNKSLKDALAVSVDDVYKEIGEIDQGHECVEDAVSLIALTINNYYKKQNRVKQAEKVDIKNNTKVTNANNHKNKVSALTNINPSTLTNKIENNQQTEVIKQKEDKNVKSNIAIVENGNKANEIEIDIFSEIDAITAKISEAVNKINKK